MTPCWLTKTSRNSLRTARINKLVHVKRDLSKTEIQYISDKLEAPCSIANHDTVINLDTSTVVRHVSVETPIDEIVKTESKIDEGGNRLPDYKPPGDKQGCRPPDDNRIRILFKKIECAPKTISPSVQKSTNTHFDLPELPKFEFKCVETGTLISDLSKLNESVTSVDSSFEINKTVSFKIDFTPTELDLSTIPRNACI